MGREGAALKAAGPPPPRPAPNAFLLVDLITVLLAPLLNSEPAQGGSSHAIQRTITNRQAQTAEAQGTVFLLIQSLINNLNYYAWIE